MLHVGALGTDFRNSSVQMRDKLYLGKENIRGFLDAIPDDSPLHEIVAVCTCNRIEIFYVCDDHDIASDWLCRFLADYHNISQDRLKSVLTNYRCEEAIRHIFRVTSGVESMVFGEHEILGQVRNAYFLYFKEEKTSSYLNRLFQQAIATGKQVRNQTAAGQGALSIASIAVERIREVAGKLSDKRILVIGTGAMGSLAFKRLAALSPGKLGLSNRTDERAKLLCQNANAEQVPFGDIEKQLNNYDVVLLATASKSFILNTDKVTSIRAQHENPLLIVDLCAPRNAEPSIGLLKNVTLVCIDDLRKTAESRLLERRSELADIEKIIEQQVKEFTRWYRYKGKCECVRN